MRDFFLESLLRKMLLCVFGGCLLAAGVVMAGTSVANGLLDDYFTGSDYIYRREQEYVDSLQVYVSREGVSVTDTDALYDWADQNQLRRFTVSRNNILLYDNVLGPVDN